MMLIPAASVSHMIYIQMGWQPTQEPPNTCHLSICRCSLNFSISLTKSQVVLSSRLAVLMTSRISALIQPKCSEEPHGVDFPAPLWSNRIISRNLIISKECVKVNRLEMYFVFFWVEEAPITGTYTSSWTTWGSMVSNQRQNFTKKHTMEKND